MKKERKIQVCSKCMRASCWYGEFMCDGARNAGLKSMAVSELEKLNLEHPRYWTEEKVKQVCG